MNPKKRLGIKSVLETELKLIAKIIQ